MAKGAGVILKLATTMAGSEQPVWSTPRQGTSASRTTHVVATLGGHVVQGLRITVAKRAGVILKLATTLVGSEQPVWSPPRQGTSSSRTTHVVATWRPTSWPWPLVLTRA